MEVINHESEKKLPDIVIVITLRVDFYGFALNYPPLGEVLQRWKPETIIAMSREDLQAAIAKPAAQVWLRN